MENNQFVRDILRGISTGIEKENPMKIGEGKNEGRDHRKNILVILSGNEKETKGVLQRLKTLKRYGVPLWVFLTKETSQTVGRDKINQILHPKVLIEEQEGHDFSPSLSDIQILLVPILSQNTAAKLKHGIHDQGQEQWIWEFLWAGKTVLASTYSLKYPNGIPPKNPFLQQMVQENMDFLTEMGVRFFDQQSYYGVLEGLWNEGPEEGMNGGKNDLSMKNHRKEDTENIKVITEKDVLGWIGKKSEIVLGKGSIITPLARDLARDKKITFIHR